ncbi:nuclease-related domain-containing protein [Virgibacillus sp. C22-A2]|uniref:Nuclease-related domain-containing protein n=2 Tax=Virgibacillus tibetensis TaxID=3042313 RepID=A0ABU6KDH0_9BACI|nr:nuclease-related domain-containing protein [Virgibacillus sp. C22-A2]
MIHILFLIPQIGKYEPDFLVISPKYGFRLIEVKNWSLNPINTAKTSGGLTIGKKVQNPLFQARKFVDDLNGYLTSYYEQLPNLYKSIAV